ncbi:MAG: GTP-binding protein EngA [Myxococcaceae bacterium]|nr:GTP-binding protein EngA [Myxococcaceae bacterium]
MTKHFKPRDEDSGLPAGLRGIPIVAVVGRPNVGKSTLFNRLARRKIAIVHDEPGVTRDRHYTDTEGFGRRYSLIDTGGFDPEDADPMKAGIASHVKLAIQEADVIVFVTDATTELTSADRAAIKLLRSSNKAVVFCANKADSPQHDAEAYNLYRAGVDVVIPVSALHGRGIGDLEAAIVNAFPPQEDEEPVDENVTRVAIVGRPNAGKSSLMNRLLGEERMMVDDKPGTTRDAIDALVERNGIRYVFIDTAGIRKKSKVTKAEDTVEAVSVLHAIRSIERAQIVVLMCDASEGVAEQDAKILGLAEDRARGLIIALNKSDLVGSRKEHEAAETLARDKLAFAPYAPIVRLSAKTGKGVNELFDAIDTVKEGFTKRIGTGELNRFFEQVLDTHPPPTSGGKAPRLFYVTQAEASPPKFIAISNAPDSIHFSYRRFVVNQLRKHFGFEGVPVRVFYKPKRKVKIGEEKTRPADRGGGTGGAARGGIRATKPSAAAKRKSRAASTPKKPATKKPAKPARA